MRLIDADKLNRKKKYLIQTQGGCFPKSEWFIKADDLFAAPTVNPYKWISVKDRLPKDDCKCLVYTDIYFIPDHTDEPDHYKGIEISKYSKRFGFLSTNALYVTHWQPLPEPPKEE